MGTTLKSLYLFIFFIQILCAKAQVAGDWARYFADNKVSFQMPQRPDSSSFLNDIFYTNSYKDSSEFSLSLCISHAPHGIYNQDSIFSAIIVGYAKRIRNGAWELLNLIDIRDSSHNIIAKEFTFEAIGDKKIIIRREYCIGRKIYSLSVEGDINRKNTVYKLKKTFFNSFKYQ